MDKVKKLIEGYQDLMQRKQVLYSRLLSLGGENPLQEESIYMRLEAIEEKQVLIEDMIYDSSSLSMKESVILDHRSTGQTLEEIGVFFAIGGERIRKILEDNYQKLSIEFEEDLKQVV